MPHRGKNCQKCIIKNRGIVVNLKTYAKQFFFQKLLENIFLSSNILFIFFAEAWPKIILSRVQGKVFYFSYVIPNFFVLFQKQLAFKKIHCVKIIWLLNQLLNITLFSIIFLNIRTVKLLISPVLSNFTRPNSRNQMVLRLIKCVFTNRNQMVFTPFMKNTFYRS